MLTYTPPPTPSLDTHSLHDALPISNGFFTRFTVLAEGERLGEVKLKASGEHNVKNALAAVAIGLELGMSFSDIQADSHSCQRSEEHTSELQSRGHLVCRLLLEKKNK